jgi:hypothetical protein
MRTLAAAALISILAVTPAQAQAGAGWAQSVGDAVNANDTGEQCLLGATRLSDRDGRQQATQRRFRERPSAIAKQTFALAHHDRRVLADIVHWRQRLDRPVSLMRMM